MDRPQVQYRPASGGAVFATVLGVITCAAFYTQSNLLFAALGLMLGGWVFAILWAWLSLRGVRVVRSTPRPVSAGDPLLLRYQLHNHQRLPVFAVVLREVWEDPGGSPPTGPDRGPPPTIPDRGPPRLGGSPITWALHVGARRGVLVQCLCRPRRRGPLRFRRIEVSSTFPFGLVRKTLRFDQPVEVLVLPRLYQLDPDLLQRLARTAAGTSRPGSGAAAGDEFYGLRDYRPGDRRNAIDWKRTARTDRPVVRELTRVESPNLAVRLDLQSTAPDPGPAPADDDQRYELEERAVSLAASLLHDAHRAGLRVSLHVAGQPAPAAVSPGHRPHLAGLLAALARVDSRHPAAVTANPPRSPAGVQVVVWPGSSSAPPPRRGGRADVLTLLGAADLGQHLAAPAVTHPSASGSAFGSASEPAIESATDSATEPSVVAGDR